MGQNKTMAEVIFEHLKWEIVTGHLKPGTRLVERDLTERFQVSRTPMREALKQLVRTQLAVDIPYRGVEVRSLGLDFAHDIYDLRFGNEGLSAYLAAERGTEEELAKIQDIFEKIDAAAHASDRDLALVLNSEFHVAIAQATHNPLLVQRIEELWTHINVVRGAAWVGNTRTDSSRDEHRAVMEAILARDPDRARAEMETHIRSSWKIVEAALHEIQEGAANGASE